MICPNCKSQIPDGSKFCNNCGCKTSLNDDESKAGDDVNDFNIRGKSCKEEVKKSFVFSGYSISYQGVSRKEVDYSSIFMWYADILTSESIYSYIHADNILQAASEVKKFYDIAANTAEHAIGKYLYDNGYSVSTEEFKSEMWEYNFDYTPYFEDINNEISNVKRYKQQSNERLENEKASRGRWEGGGFGVKGAIKGALTAGALNMVGDAFNGVGDALQNSANDNIVNEKYKDLLSNDSIRNSLCYGIKELMATYYYAFIKFIGRQTNEKFACCWNPDEAHKIYSNNEEYENDSTNKIDNISKCIEMDLPTWYVYDEKLIDKLKKNEYQDLAAFLEYWNFPKYVEIIGDRINEWGNGIKLLAVYNMCKNIANYNNGETDSDKSDDSKNGNVITQRTQQYEITKEETKIVDNFRRRFSVLCKYAEENLSKGEHAKYIYDKAAGIINNEEITPFVKSIINLNEYIYYIDNCVCISDFNIYVICPKNENESVFSQNHTNVRDESETDVILCVPIYEINQIIYSYSQIIGDFGIETGDYSSILEFQIKGGKIIHLDLSRDGCLESSTILGTFVNIALLPYQDKSYNNIKFPQGFPPSSFEIEWGEECEKKSFLSLINSMTTEEENIAFICHRNLEQKIGFKAEEHISIANKWESAFLNIYSEIMTKEQKERSYSDPVGRLNISTSYHCFAKKSEIESSVQKSMKLSEDQNIIIITDHVALTSTELVIEDERYELKDIIEVLVMDTLKNKHKGEYGYTFYIFSSSRFIVSQKVFYDNKDLYKELTYYINIALKIINNIVDDQLFMKDSFIHCLICGSFGPNYSSSNDGILGMFEHLECANPSCHNKDNKFYNRYVLSMQRSDKLIDKDYINKMHNQYCAESKMFQYPEYMKKQYINCDNTNMYTCSFPTTETGNFKYCPKCGHRSDIGASFCGKCGTKFEKK